MLASLQRLPSFVVNGIGVAIGVGVTRLVLGVAAGGHFADVALTGAICTSLADVPARPEGTAQRVVAGAVTGGAAATLMALLHPHPALLAGGIALIVFLATMMLGWGPRAGPVSFAAVLAVVFTMSLPRGQGALEVLKAHAAGAGVYIVWAVGTSALLQRRYRALALAAAIDATAQLLRARAAAVAQAGGEAALETSRGWVLAEARLAERLQAARNLLFPAAPGARVQRQTAALLRLIDMRDVVLASSVELNRLDDADGAREALRRTLLDGAERLARCRDAVSGGARLPAAAAAGGAPGDGVAAPSELDLRRQQLADDLARLEGLLRGDDEVPPFGARELRRFVAPEGWPLRDLLAQATPASPVFRHALRAAAALSAAYTIALFLPWGSHPQWLVLSVAVVLRGNLEQTLSRRNTRVLGTMLGCLVVVLLAHFASGPVATAAFLAAIGLAHGFAIEQYLVTATAGTVMALLQAHAVAPAGGFPIAERVADTLLGAVLAWAFSFVLPSWERRGLPRAIQKVLLALAEYTRAALRADDAAAPGLARRHAYDALGLLTTSLQRVAAEPAAARPSAPALAAALDFVDQAQRFTAQVSMLRLMAAQGPGGEAAPQRALDAVAAALVSGTPPPAAEDGAPAWRQHIASLQRNAVGAGQAARAALTALRA